jgi:hypothetical protein
VDARFPSPAPDLIRPVAGVRVWRIAPTLWWQLGGLLWSPSMKEPWPTGEVYRASCRLDHEPGSEGCACGVYAYFSPELARRGDYWPKTNREIAGVIGAAGEVDLWSKGMRAGRATVEAIFTAGYPDEELPLSRQEIADAYPSADGGTAEVIDEADYHAFCEERGFIVYSPEDFTS